ncbi:NB-ARC domain-containing protein [Actinoallomurus spadix]|nr:AfsR/SARP family transcriptional regulator [Actinoallomurus spadix]MCO5990605.1 NB-ARC domain-containing protein [Actinoallomurus spadix]
MEFRILGPIEARLNGKSIALDGTKQQTMLAALLMARGRLISDDRLSQLLWGDNPPSTASAQIYTYASRLRKCLGDEVTIVRRSPGYTMSIGSSRIDQDDFLRLARSGARNLQKERFSEAARELRGALSLWRGPALANTTEHLLMAESSRLEEARMSALEDRIEADLALGQHLQLVSELRGLVAEYPLREKIRSQLMIVLYQTGRQADALEVFHEGRRLLAEELGVDPSAELRGTYQSILAADPALAARAERHRTPPVITLPRSAMLPPNVIDFTGRSEHLRRLSELLSARQDADVWPPTTFLISGMAGVGKSALAIRAAYAQTASFPDGRLYVDLGGTDRRPLGPADALLILLRAIGVDDTEIPPDLDQRTQFYRSMLAGLRVLILLDNASDDQQIRPLLPWGNESRVIITSRRNIASLEGVHLTTLDVFNPVEAMEMLTRLIGPRRVATEKDQARKLVELCGYLPVAIRAAGTRLITKPHWSLSQLVARMSDPVRRLDELRLGHLDVRARIKRSFMELPERERHALCSLSLIESPDFSAHTAGEVLGLPYEEAEELVERHVDARLLTANFVDEAGHPLYRIHELVRMFALEAGDDAKVDVRP